ncbi:unnamed protein product [Caenorhabditis angaria]|uniref:Uncharacterized protein n=1 Tax=Caenorhabditis angaria TaxID=860376 RepID=A0A9P1I8Y3_9PELO|nr:unnamed protein product [Caenorhabditis angaria]
MPARSQRNRPKSTRSPQFIEQKEQKSTGIPPNSEDILMSQTMDITDSKQDLAEAEKSSEKPHILNDTMAIFNEIPDRNLAENRLEIPARSQDSLDISARAIKRAGNSRNYYFESLAFTTNDAYIAYDVLFNLTAPENLSFKSTI